MQSLRVGGSVAPKTPCTQCQHSTPNISAVESIKRKARMISKLPMPLPTGGSTGEEISVLALPRRRKSAEITAIKFRFSGFNICLKLALALSSFQNQRQSFKNNPFVFLYIQYGIAPRTLTRETFKALRASSTSGVHFRAPLYSGVLSRARKYLI